MHEAGMKNPFACDATVDVDSSNLNWKLTKSPCLTRTRCMGHWIVSRGRRQNLDEQMRLMGMNPALISKEIISQKNLGELLGNAMAVNVLERILLRVYFKLAF